MLVTFVPDKSEFAVGEKVAVTLNITNIGSKTFTFFQGGRADGFRDNQFAFFSGAVRQNASRYWQSA